MNTDRSIRANLNLIGMLAIVFMFLLSAQLQAADKDPAKAWQMIAQGAVIIDVRTTDEFNAGHLDNALHIPYEQIVDGLEQHGISKETPIVLYCRSGRRSGIAFDASLAKGYNLSYNGGGYETLMANKPK